MRLESDGVRLVDADFRLASEFLASIGQGGSSEAQQDCRGAEGIQASKGGDPPSFLQLSHRRNAVDRAADMGSFAKGYTLRELAVN